MGNIQEELRGFRRNRNRGASRVSAAESYLNNLRDNDEGKPLLTEAARAWAKHTAKRLQGRVSALGLREKVLLSRQVSRIRVTKGGTVLREPPLEESIGSSVKTSFGIPSRVNFQFVRHGIFVEDGVGRNRKTGSGKERPRPWLKPVLEPAIDELADLLSEAGADSVLAEIKFSIPGILSRRATIKNNG